jgi:hypothetical protein
MHNIEELWEYANGDWKIDFDTGHWMITWRFPYAGGTQVNIFFERGDVGSKRCVRLSSW